MGILAAATALHIPTVMVCGQADIRSETEFKKVYALTELEGDIEKCIATPAPLLVKIGQQISKELLLN